MIPMILMTEPTAIFIKSEKDFQNIKSQVVEEFLMCLKNLLPPIVDENYLEFKRVADDVFRRFKNVTTRSVLFDCITNSFVDEEDYLRIANDYCRQYMEDQNDV